MQKSLEGIKPLAGLKVIDIATLFAAPFAATLFGDFGADVIKVEIPGHGDPLRSMGSTKNKVPLWWKIYSRNKQTITIDLRTSSGQNVLKELVRDADVLIENFRPGTMESWNLGWENLKELNPKLIMLRVSGYGRTGPYSNKPGFGTLCEGMSGFAVLNGQPNGPPTVAPMAVGDCIAGLYGAVGVLVALFARAQGLCQGQAVVGQRYGQVVHIAVTGAPGQNFIANDQHGGGRIGHGLPHLLRPTRPHFHPFRKRLIVCGGRSK